MSRQIKFRVWDKRKNKFISDTVEQTESCYIVRRVLINLGGELHITREEEKPDGDVDIITPEYSDEFILSQFTGLHDKNGKEIYEGDIVRIDGDNEIEVKFNNFLYWSMEYVYREDNTEIIGNIYENPELLKEAKP